MMSSQWEVVGGKKAKTNGHQPAKLTKSDKKKFAENAPKAEDILPLVEVQTLYTKLDKKKNKIERDDSSESKDSDKTKNNKDGNKKQENGGSAKPAKKKPSPPPRQQKEETPEQKARAALKSVDVSEVQSLVESGKLHYAEEPSVWLRFLATNLTSKLSPAVSSYLNIEDLSSSVLELSSGELKKLLVSIARDLELPMRQAFYENCLSAIANDVSKDLKVDGWLLLVEVLSHVSPELAVNNLSRYESLMVSYQNRPVVGKHLLWSLGQAGMRNLAIGAKTWHAIFRSRAETKNYSKVVASHFGSMIIAASTKSKNVAENNISLEQYRNFLQMLISKNFVGAPKVENAFRALQVLAGKTNNVAIIFEELFNQFEGNHFSDGDKSMKQVMDGLIWCLKQDVSESGVAWTTILNNKSFTKAPGTTYQLLKHLELNWNGYSKDLAASDSLRDGFEGVMKQVLNKCDSMKGDSKVPSQLSSSSSQIAQNLINRLKKIEQESPRKMGGFPWKTANLVLIIAISSIVAYDINIHNGFEKSSTGIFLKNTGALHYGQIAWDKTREYYNVAYKWGEKEIPPVWAQYGAPTWSIAKEQSLKLYDATRTIALNIAGWASETWPKVVSTIDEYAPGLTDKVAEYAQLGWQYTKSFGAMGYDYGLEGVSWVNKTMFDGQLSTAYLSKMSVAAFNASQSFALDTYQWISQMIPVKANPAAAVPQSKRS